MKRSDKRGLLSNHELSPDENEMQIQEEIEVDQNFDVDGNHLLSKF